MGSIARTDYERRLKAWWDEKTDDPINLLLGEEDGLYHHHFGVGDYDHSVLKLQGRLREKAILAEMHRLENAQAEHLLSALGPLSAGAKVLDGGSGRGGTSMLVGRRLGADVLGVNICQHHNDFAERMAKEHGLHDQLTFRYANMADTGLPDDSFDAIFTNETTMYCDLDELFAEFARLLRPGGRYTLVTWCGNDVVGGREEIEAIDRYYCCHIHDRSRYFSALSRHGFVPIMVRDLTAEAIPYFDLRSYSSLATGIEQPYMEGYRSNRINYLYVTTELASKSDRRR